MNQQAEFVALLKTKGTGPTMSKSLDEKAIETAESLLKSDNVHLTTKSTFITALLTLESTTLESEWISKLEKNPAQFLPEPLDTFFFKPPITDFQKSIRRVIQGKALSNDDAKRGFEALFAPHYPEYEKAAFLEALRLRRESIEENQIAHDIFWEKSQHKKANIPLLIDMANAYDGMNRTPYLTPFTAVLLGSVGFPSLLQGIDEIGPKNGVNPSKILKAAGIQAPPSFDTTIHMLENPEVAWGYIDESVFSPALFHLKSLRLNMVKRPILATLEKLLQPIQAKKNLTVLSFTHPPYKETLTQILSHKNRFNNWILYRGSEGGIQPPSDRRFPVITCQNNVVAEQHFGSITDFGFEQNTLPETEYTAEKALEIGLDILKGNRSQFRDIVLYQALFILFEFGLLTDAIRNQLIHSLDSGKALKHFERGLHHVKHA